LSLFEAEESNSTSWIDVLILSEFGKSVQPIIALEKRTNTSTTFYFRENDKPDKCRVSNYNDYIIFIQ
jgi:hypothetical protein